MRDLHAKKDRVKLKCLTWFVQGMLMLNANARATKSANKERRKKGGNRKRQRKATALGERAKEIFEKRRKN